MVTVQRGFWNDTYIGSIKQKLEEIRNSNPKAFESEKECVLEYYTVYENLPKILGDEWETFRSWFLKAPSSEAILRARRLIKEEHRNNGNNHNFEE